MFEFLMSVCVALTYMLMMYIAYLFLLFCMGDKLEDGIINNPWYIFVILFWPVLLPIQLFLVIIKFNGKKVFAFISRIDTKVKSKVKSSGEKLRSKL